MMILEIARAGEAEAPACLALLPEMVGAPAELLIARKNGEFAGAAAVVWANLFEPAGFNVTVKVLSGARRQGVGRALIRAAADLADGETDGLWSHGGALADSLAARFFGACGFAPRKREYHFKVGVESLFADVGPIAERFRARGHIPQAAEILSLSEADAPLEEIAWMVSREFNSNPVLNVHDLRRRQNDDADLSLFIRLDGELVGALLLRIMDDTAIVDVNVVAKRRRSGWANLALLEQGLQRCRAAALRHIHFFCDETVNDTIKLARRGEGEDVGVKARYYLAFDETGG